MAPGGMFGPVMNFCVQTAWFAGPECANPVLLSGNANGAENLESLLMAGKSSLGQWNTFERENGPLVPPVRGLAEFPNESRFAINSVLGVLFVIRLRKAAEDIICCLPYISVGGEVAATMQADRHIDHTLAV